MPQLFLGFNGGKIKSFFELIIKFKSKFLEDKFVGRSFGTKISVFSGNILLETIEVLRSEEITLFGKLEIKNAIRIQRITFKINFDFTHKIYLEILLNSLI